MVAKDQKNTILSFGCRISTEETLPREVQGVPTVAVAARGIQGDEGHVGERRRIIRDGWEDVQREATGK